MKTQIDLENSLSCRACLPKSKLETTRNSSRERNISSRIKISQNFDIKRFRIFESVSTIKRVVLRQNKQVCDVACSTGEIFEPTESFKRKSPILPTSKSKEQVTISFTKLNLPSVESRESFLQRFPSSVRKSLRVTNNFKERRDLTSREFFERDKGNKRNYK